jgi:hypothetical protein
VGQPPADQERPALIRSKREAGMTVVLYALLPIALVGLAVDVVSGDDGLWLGVVFVLLAVFLQSSWLHWSRVWPVLWEQKKADAPADGVGYVLAMLKPYPPSRALRAFPPGPLIAAIRLLRRERSVTPSEGRGSR